MHLCWLPICSFLLSLTAPGIVHDALLWGWPRWRHLFADTCDPVGIHSFVLRHCGMKNEQLQMCLGQGCHSQGWPANINVWLHSLDLDELIYHLLHKNLRRESEDDQFLRKQSFSWKKDRKGWSNSDMFFRGFRCPAPAVSTGFKDWGGNNKASQESELASHEEAWALKLSLPNQY